MMSNIKYVSTTEDFKFYKPAFVLKEDPFCDDRFCVIEDKNWNIAFSYTDIGVKPHCLKYNGINFIGFGRSYYVIDMTSGKVLYESTDVSSIMYETVVCSLKRCIVAVGECTVIGFQLDGNMIWKNTYPNIIYDWEFSDMELTLTFENGEKWEIAIDKGY